MLYASLHRKSTLPEEPVKLKKNQNFAVVAIRFIDLLRFLRTFSI